jgi:hypothetical protein
MSDTKQALEGAAPLVAQELVELASDAAEALNSAVRESVLGPHVEAQPYAMVAGALGVGYVLGGGLFTPTTSRILSLGAKLLSVPMVQNQLLNLAEGALDAFIASQPSKK